MAPSEHISCRIVLNPLRSEREAFRLLIYVAVVFGVIIAVVLIARAL
jgi:predicted nucleic acid-binding Zn ribbon protein